MKSDSTHKDERSSEIAQHTPLLEWIASGIGLLLVVCMLGFIGWQALDDPRSPPAITVEASDVSSVPGGYRVIFQARNAGGAAAAQVRIDGVVSTGNQGPETSSVILDYIPGHSAREGGLFFTQDPRTGNLALRASGFAKP
ncbi:TIGR02588 family protein [Microvirga sp. P5_D2]